MRRALKGEFNEIKATFIHPKDEQNGTPGLLARTRWGKSKPVMNQMLLSMTVPFHVDDDVDECVNFIRECIAGNESERLTKDDIWDGELVELYCLSYKHESQDRVERISTDRLRKVVSVIRSHASGQGTEYYSIWIDSLYPEKDRDPIAEWADRGLPPYALCYVVLSPSPEGFHRDTKRAWIRCEHQLAATSRGILFHVNDEAPKWAVGWPLQSRGRTHIKINGGNLDPRYALRVLALAISSGLLEGTLVSFETDLQMLKRWSANVMCTKWPRFGTSFLPKPTATPLPDRSSRLENVVTNIAQINWWGTSKTNNHWDIIEEVSFIHDLGPQRPWYTGYDLAYAICGRLGLNELDGFNSDLFEQIEEYSQAYIVHCENKSMRGLVVFSWTDFQSDAILLDVELENSGENSQAVKGYRLIYNSELRRKFNGWDICGVEDGVKIGLQHCGDILNELTARYYVKLGLVAEDMESTSAEDWVVSS